MEEGRSESEFLSVANRPAHDAAKNVAAAFVRRHDAVANQECSRSRMVSDDAEAGSIRRAWAVGGLRLSHFLSELRSAGDDFAESVGVVVGGDFLKDRSDALEARSRVDRRLRQRGELARRVAIVLHEHQIPELHVAVAVATHGARGFAAAVLSAAVDEKFRARSAGAGIAHRPEVIFFSEAVNAVFGNAFLLMPDFGGFIVLFEDRDKEAVLRKFQLLGDEFPSKANRVFFEVIAKGEVAEHFKERVVTGREADVFQIVVFAACANALLNGDGSRVRAGVFAQEHVFELNHAGVDEEKRRVVLRDERGALDHGVAVALEILQESRPDLFDFHAGNLTARPGVSKPCRMRSKAPDEARVQAFSGLSGAWGTDSAARGVRVAHQNPSATTPAKAGQGFFRIQLRGVSRAFWAWSSHDSRRSLTRFAAVGKSMVGIQLAPHGVKGGVGEQVLGRKRARLPVQGKRDEAKGDSDQQGGMSVATVHPVAECPNQCA